MINSNKRPNYKLATVKAYQVIKKFNINEVPIDLNNIINKIPNLKVFSYEWLSSITNYSIQEIKDMFEGGFISKKIIISI